MCGILPPNPGLSRGSADEYMLGASNLIVSPLRSISPTTLTAMKKKRNSTVKADLLDTSSEKAEKIDRSEESRSASGSPTNSGKSFWSRLTDPQAAVIAAIIAATVSLVAAGISVWSTSYTKELSTYNAHLQSDVERSKKTLLAYDEATKAIRHMKNQIQ